MEVTRFPGVIVPGVNVPVCVVSRCVFASVAKCVLQRTHSGSARACVRATPCMDETPRVTETPCVDETLCVSGVVTSVPGCVLPSTLCMSETLCMDEAPRVEEAACAGETARVCEPACMKETPRVSERPSMRKTACVRSLCVREMTVGMREHATASPGVNVMVRCLSLVTRRSACVEWRWRRRRQMDKGRVAAVAEMGNVPGWHSSERKVRTVPGTRPPRARLRE